MYPNLLRVYCVQVASTQDGQRMDFEPQDISKFYELLLYGLQVLDLLFVNNFEGLCYGSSFGAGAVYFSRTGWDHCGCWTDFANAGSCISNGRSNNSGQSNKQDSARPETVGRSQRGIRWRCPTIPIRAWLFWKQNSGLPRRSMDGRQWGLRCRCSTIPIWKLLFWEPNSGLARWSKVQTLSRWWFQTFFIFTPTWGNDPIWLIFFKWVETTN